MADKLLTGILLENDELLNLEQFCLAVQSERKTIIKMVEFQLVQPVGESPEEWRFDSISLKRGRIAVSFYRDLEINMAGIALALDLLKKIESLEQDISLLQRMLKE